MANFGKRMVKEDLIKQIGQGATYEAGTGIDIVEDVISVDSDVAMKTDLPDAVSGTNDGTNWTSLTVGNDTYAIPQSSSVDIDNKTIIENTDGKLETAVGGWKELVSPASTETVTGFTNSGGDFVITDATKVNDLYNKIKNFSTLTMTFTCSDGLNGYTPTVTFKNVTISDGKWNYNNSTAETNNFIIGFYVDTAEGNEKIYMYFISQPTNILTVSEASIEIPEVANYTQIDPRYIYETIELNSGWVELSAEEAAELDSKINKIRFKYNNRYYYLSNSSIGAQKEYTFINTYDSLDINSSRGVYERNSITVVINGNSSYINYSTNTYEILTTDKATIKFSPENIGTNRTLGTVIGGGYSNENIDISASDLTQSGSNYTCSNTVFTKSILQTMAYTNVTEGTTGIYMNFINAYDGTINLLVEAQKDDTHTDYYEFTSTNNNLIPANSTFRINKETLELITDPTTVEYSADFYNFLNDNDLRKVENKYPQGAKIIETVDPKFLPGFNVAPTTAGTYTLQATVDAQGNVTYTWVTVTP